jgi:cell division septation protein DedD
MMLGASALCPPDNVAAQSSDQVYTSGQVYISVEPRIRAKAASEVAIAIKIGPAHVAPPRSFVSLRGLPAQVSLRDGHLIAPGLWAIPLSALPTLRAWIPAYISGEMEIGIRLIGMDGRLLAQATAALIVESSNTTQPPVPAGPAPSAPAAVARQPPPSNVGQEDGSQTSPGPPQLPSAERKRAEHLLARGLDYLTVGNVAAARDFFERAAEIGLAAAALRLATTYDPVELPRFKVHGVVADPNLARKWYERARDLGAPEAASQLARLGGGS